MIGVVTIIYDGDCPFCSNYIRLIRLRETAEHVELINARASWHPIVDQLKNDGYDLNEGMAVVCNDRIYLGEDAVHFLALNSQGTTTFNRINAWIFRSKCRSKILYPMLRFGRNMTLRVLGVPPIARQDWHPDREGF